MDKGQFRTLVLVCVLHNVLNIAFLLMVSYSALAKVNMRPERSNMGALIIRIQFWSILCRKYNKEPTKIVLVII